MKPPADPTTISALVLDVDGVLTDGRIGYGTGSDDEIKFFDVQDGFGIRLLIDSGIKVGVLSGRGSKANRRRASELGLDFVIEGQRDKDSAFTLLLQQEGLEACQCVYMGDDLFDLPVMRRAGIAAAPGNAVAEVKRLAHWVTNSRGGCGAVREVAERILCGKGLWHGIVARYGGTA
jgi:3-deoxy-D-manno-octulosonate 8-phosphate phosphatase (KDO 8-P phosphatase)